MIVGILERLNKSPTRIPRPVEDKLTKSDQPLDAAARKREAHDKKSRELNEELKRWACVGTNNYAPQELDKELEVFLDASERKDLALHVKF